MIESVRRPFRCRASGPCHGVAGFTLVELLVVIGIIGVLVAILMPTLSRVRAHAQSTRCLSNLRQIGQACMMYAAENKGFLPPSQIDSIEAITGGGAIANGGLPSWPSHQLKQQFIRLLSGGTSVFYCPSNDLWEGEATTTASGFTFPAHDPAWFEEQPVFAGTSSVRIQYWYFGNPYRPSGPRTGIAQANGTDTDGYFQFVDTNNDGSNRDEYILKSNEKRAEQIAIATDQTRQNNGGWTFFHGTRRNISAVANPVDNQAAAVMRSSWKNNLYGDGHAEPKRPDECKLRWAPTNPAMW